MLSVLAIPVTLFTYAKAVSAYAMSFPWWLAVLIVLSHFISLLTLGILVDTHREKTPPINPGQDVPPLQF